MITIPYTYLIRHKDTGNLYHGSRTAKGCHPDELLKEDGYSTSSKHVKNAIKENGIESFEIINIEIFDTAEETRLAEKRYHEKYDVKGNVYYFNQHNAGNKWFFSSWKNAKHPNLGSKMSEETKRKISKSRSRYKGENHPFYGKTHSDETKKKISIANKGKVRTEDFKKRISEVTKGGNNGMYGKEHSEETKRKISLRASERIILDETKKKISIANKGKVRTEETKRKISVSNVSKVRVSCVHCKKETSLNHINLHISKNHKDVLCK